ncbi:Hsp33 protein [Oceanithermus profundus DSM 14977]|uniref:33 kDa chaperonin n=1 Tax=Oceanithermus profundus (strain DSM 14977 / NBRC 100410 / VKM B-2274 / 506) TaxID=670487 RepID=E4U8M7_OCEP5|nr:Hsp33 family molecular chaperone HslO [Oceanithermus profundus]ADR36707.1 Hsp33 protein [Oceanithermus profundus DSM 14977]
MGRLVRGLAADGRLRVLAAETTDVVEEARRRHGTSPTATAALGRALTGAALLAFLLSKSPRERVTLIVDGDGPLGGLVAEAGVDGAVRGYVKNPAAEAELRADGKLNVGALVGAGELRVVRVLAGGEQFDSSVPLVSGEIAEDLAHYLWQSEQIPSAVLLGVRVAPGGHVEAAGGLVVQVLPDADEEAIARLERNLAGVRGFTDLLVEHGLEGAARRVLEGLGLEWTDLRSLGYAEDAVPLRFACRCSREKAADALAYFDPEEREAMIREDGGAEVVCHWCGEVYRFSPEELRALGAEEVRCPDCGELWYKKRADGVEIVYPDPVCKCGRPVEAEPEPPSA